VVKININDAVEGTPNDFGAELLRQINLQTDRVFEQNIIINSLFGKDVIFVIPHALQKESNLPTTHADYLKLQSAIGESLLSEKTEYEQ